VSTETIESIAPVLTLKPGDESVIKGSGWRSSPSGSDLVTPF
jgi:hypothetical protein